MRSMSLGSFRVLARVLLPSSLPLLFGGQISWSRVHRSFKKFENWVIGRMTLIANCVSHTCHMTFQRIVCFISAIAFRKWTANSRHVYAIIRRKLRPKGRYVVALVWSELRSRLASPNGLRNRCLNRYITQPQLETGI